MIFTDIVISGQNLYYIVSLNLIYRENQSKRVVKVNFKVFLASKVTENV
jgi:hypothetical protein